jgi:tetratricopeptide (TPR) repeat protein
MPFKKTNVDSKDAHSLADARKIFIGRTSEILFFIQHVLKPEDPTYHIISISGQGGVGKSTLLNRFIGEMHESDFKDYCLTALVNERQTTPANIMEKFADQLPFRGDFEKALSQYKETLRKLQSEREAAREALWRQATTDVAGSLVKAVPVMGGMLEKVAGSTIGYIWEELHYRQLLKDAERLEDPIRDLTKIFVKELNQVADTSVTAGLSRIRRQRRVVLFFDTFEQLAAEAAPWLLDYFLETDISSNVVLVVAGREVIDRSTPDDPKRWLHYHDENIIHVISLERFTQAETQTYLAERGITDPTQVDTYWQLSRGLPLYLGLLTSNQQGDVDPTKDVVDNFLRWIPKQEQVKQRLALDAACFSRPFNQDDLAAFSYIPEQERSQLYLWLTGQPFIRSSPQDGRYIYHELARDLFCRYLYQRSRGEYHTTRRALAEHYQQQLERLQIEGGKDVYDSTEWLELVIALSYQYLLLPDETSHIRAIAEGLRMYTHVQRRGAIVEVLREEGFRLLKLLSQEPFNSQLSLGIRLVITQLLQSDESNLGGQEALLVSNFLIEKVGHDPAFPTELLALLYEVRGEGYELLENYQQAIHDYTHALALDPHLVGAYNARGYAYHQLKSYQSAIEDYNRAIELDDKYTSPYRNRGQLYTSLKEYRNAVTDFSRAIELDSRTAWVYGRRGYANYQLKEYEQAIKDYDHMIELDSKRFWAYNERGLVYYALEKYERAIEDFDREIELDSEKAWVCRNRGDAYYRLKEYERAIKDYDRMIDLGYKHAWAYNKRGLAYYALEKYKRAIEDFDRAIELDSEKAWVYRNRGDANDRLKEYERAIEDFDRAIELDSEIAGFYEDRGSAYYALNKYERAVEDYNRAIELAPRFANAYAKRGLAYIDLNEYLRAIEDYSQAIELVPTYKWAYFQRGYAYLWLKDIQQAKANLARCLELDASRVQAHWMDTWIGMCQERPDREMVQRLEEIVTTVSDTQRYGTNVCRGIILWGRGSFEQALIQIEQAISLDPTIEDAYFWKGMICASLRKDEEAITAITKALELKLPPVLLTPLRWLDKDRQDFCQKYVEPLLTRYDILPHQETSE